MSLHRFKLRVEVGVDIEVEAESKDIAESMVSDNIAMTCWLADLKDGKDFWIYEDSIYELDIYYLETLK